MNSQSPIHTPILTPNPKEYKLKIEEQADVFNQISRDINTAVELRNKVRPELDGKTLQQAYVENERFSHSFNSPKVNKDEVKAVTGVAEKKTDVLYSEVLASNFQPTIIPYDRFGVKIHGLGNELTAIVKMSNEMEYDEDFWTLYAKELLTQMAVFSDEEDIYEELKQDKKLKLNIRGGNILNLNDGRQVVHYCKKRVLTALQVYLGDTSIPYLFFQEQPFIFKYFLMSYGQFLRYYGGYPNARFVTPSGPNSDLYPPNYKIHENINNMVEVVVYINPDKNWFAVRANGFYLYDSIQPLPYTVLPNRRYTVEMNANKLISANYAYGRAPISSAKTLQAVNTEMLRLMIRKFRQSVEPSLLNYSNQIYGSDVWLPSAITKVGAEGDLKLLNPNAAQGITQGEYNMYDLVEKKIQEYIGAGDIQQGIEGNKTTTATQVVNQQKNFMRNMALTFNAIARAKKQSTKQRILNIFENHLDPIDKKEVDVNGTKEIRDIYERFASSDMTLPDGRKGTLVSIFTDRQVSPEELQAFELEEDKMEDKGVLIRYRFINKSRLFEFLSGFNIIVENKPQEGSEMAKVLFGEKLNQAALLQKLAGSQLNKSEVEDQFENIWDAKNFFMKNAAAQNMMMIPDQQQSTMIGDQMMEGAETGIPKKPSLNSLVGNLK